MMTRAAIFIWDRKEKMPRWTFEGEYSRESSLNQGEAKMIVEPGLLIYLGLERLHLILSVILVLNN